MEGVLVSATKAGSNITVTVVTGADGRYSFPAKPPRRQVNIALAVRAVGFELAQPQGKVEIRRSKPRIRSRNAGSQAPQDH